MWSLQRWHRRRILSRHPIAEPLWQQVAGLPLLQRLTASDLDRLRELTTLFLHRKTITGAGGLQVDEEMALRLQHRPVS